MKEHFRHKITGSTKEALAVLGQCCSENSKVVFTNGCFDILHSGHLQYLQEARELGDFLIIGVNNDDSVKRLKGAQRPILPLSERMEMLSALQMVDMVIPFEEDTPERLISELKPHILVKGGDYSIDEIVGADDVIQYGGEVKVLSFKKGVSTSNIIDVILNRFK